MDQYSPIQKTNRLQDGFHCCFAGDSVFYKDMVGKLKGEAIRHRNVYACDG